MFKIMDLDPRSLADWQVEEEADTRLKNFREEGTLDTYVVPPCNWDFYQSSSWINFYLGRDHSAGKFGIQKP
jgi:methylenetetrahydrofolate reductase (NADPH)